MLAGHNIIYLCHLNEASDQNAVSLNWLPLDKVNSTKLQDMSSTCSPSKELFAEEPAGLYRKRVMTSAEASLSHSCFSANYKKALSQTVM